MTFPIVLALLPALLAEDTPRQALESYQAGSKAFAERRFTDAITAFKQSLALDPKQLRVTRLLGLSYQLAGQLPEAEAAFQRATTIAPNDGESWYYLGRVYYARNFFDRSLAALQNAAKLAPKDARVHECLALTLEALGDHGAAEKSYQQALLSTPPLPTIAMNYGALLLRMNRIAESEPLLKKAAAAMPQSWQPHFELARLYYLTARMNDALRELAAAAKCEANDEETRRTYALLANVYSRLGRHEEAQRAAATAEQ